MPTANGVTWMTMAMCGIPMSLRIGFRIAKETGSGSPITAGLGLAMNRGVGRPITTVVGSGLAAHGVGGLGRCTAIIGRSGLLPTSRSGAGAADLALESGLVVGAVSAGCHLAPVTGSIPGGADTADALVGLAGGAGKAAGLAASIPCTTVCDSRTWRICMMHMWDVRCQQLVLASSAQGESLRLRLGRSN
jgi:hypothetical protein